MQANNITVYNCTGVPLNMTASCGVSASNQSYPPPTTTYNIKPYQDTPQTITFNQTYPYNLFTFIGTNYFGQTNYYRISSQSNYVNTAETEWCYTIYVGISPNVLISADGSDVSSEMLDNMQNNATCTSSCTCGFVYLSYYPTWFINGIKSMGQLGVTVNSSISNLAIFVVIILVILVIAVVAVMLIKKYK